MLPHCQGCRHDPSLSRPHNHYMKTDYQGCPTAITKNCCMAGGIWQLEERESTSSRVHEARTDGVLESGL